MAITKKTEDGVEIVTITGEHLDKFKEWLSTQLYGEPPAGACPRCKEAYNVTVYVFTAAGWRETKLSGLCDRCWDELFKEEE